MTKKAVIFKLGMVLLASFAINIWAAKPTVKITALPTSIATGSSSTLTWTSTGATSASINQGIGSVAVNGSRVVTPIKTTTYTITARNSSSSTTSSATITVKAAPPTVSFSAAPPSISLGQSSTLSWTTTNATSASIDQSIGTVALNGSKIVSPTTTKTYTITVKGSGGTVTAKATVTVAATPPTVTFSALPASISLGQSSTLTWTSTNATSVTIDQGIGSVTLNGSKIVTPSQSIIYTLTATGTGGTVTSQASVQVISIPTVTLTVNPPVIQPGETATLSWTSTNANSASIDQGIGAVALNGSMSVSPTSSVIYSITVSGSGGTATATVNLIVSSGKKCYAFIPDSYDKNIRVIDTETNILFKTITADGTDTDLRGAAAEQSGVFVYIVDRGYSNNRILKIDPLTMTVVETLSLAANFQGHPIHIAVAADGCFLYTTSSIPMWDPGSAKYVGMICTIKTSGDRLASIRGIMTDLPHQVSLEGLVVSKDNSRLYVADPDNNQILVLDTAKLQRSATNMVPVSDELIATIPLASPPLELTFSPDGRMLYATTSNSLIIIDAQSYAVIKTITVGSSSDNVCFVKVHPDGSKVFIVARNGLLSVVETVNYTTIWTGLYTGSTQCQGFDIHPDGSRLFIVDAHGSNTTLARKLLTFDSLTCNLIAAINLGRTPRAYGNFLSYLPISIAGNVKQDGNGLSGVTLTLDGEGILRTKQTDANGDFLFTLKTGNYLLTPTFSTLDFFPEIMDLQVSENKTGLDFVVTGVHPLPTVEFSASKTYVKKGVIIALTWSSTDAQYVIFDDGHTTQRPANGTVNYSMQCTKTFSVTAHGKGGTAYAQVIVFVGSKPPQLTLAASPSTIAPGGQTTLTWTSTNLTSASMDNGIGSVALNGSKVVTPAQTTTYTISGIGDQGCTIQASATVIVNAAVPAVLMTSSPGTINSGESATLTWTSSNATSASIDNSIGTVPVNGSKVVTPAQTTTYIITVTGPGGSNTAQATVTVEVPQSQVQFKADPEVLPPGQSATLTWTTANVTSANIDNGIGTVPINGSVKVTPTQDTTYIITVTGPGGTTTASVTVKMLFNHLYSLWNGMKTAMLAGNVNQVVAQFSDQTRDKYSEIFTAIADQLPQIAQGMREIEPVYFEEFGAKYRIKRTEVIEGISYDITYYIYFVQEEDGSWKILNY